MNRPFGMPNASPYVVDATLAGGYGRNGPQPIFPNETVATMNKLISLWHDESGQDLAEYAMILGLVALAVLVTVTLLGSSVSATITDIDTTLQASI